MHCTAAAAGLSNYFGLAMLMEVKASFEALQYVYLFIYFTVVEASLERLEDSP